jgi:cytochrome c peroxidase
MRPYTRGARVWQAHTRALDGNVDCGRESSRPLRSAAPWAAVALVALSGLAAAQQPSTPGFAVDAGWRKVFVRPALHAEATPDAETAEKIALGARLFADGRLSGNGQRSCASCHRPERAFTDGRRVAVGISGRPLLRNTPSLFNLAWSKYYAWDGRAPSLEMQVGRPIEAADELGGDWSKILERLERDPAMVASFKAAFSEQDGVSPAGVRAALAAYVRSLVSPPTRFDAYVEGDQAALSGAEVRGFRLFVGKAGCVLCHVGWRFTDDRFHDIGLPSRDPGRSEVPGGTPGLKAFKTPSLRELVHTPPYMHDGSLPTLAAVLRHYAGGFIPRPSLAPNMNRHLRLAAKEKWDLIAFLRALSSERSPGAQARPGPH